MRWIIITNTSGEAVFETFNKNTAMSVNTLKYEVLTAMDYLQRFAGMVSCGNLKLKYMKLDETKLQEVVEKIAYQQFGAEQIDDLYAKMGILNNYVQEQLHQHFVVGQSEQLKAFVDWWHGLSQEELAWYEGRYVEVFLSL